MTKKKKLLAILIIGLAVIVLAGGIVFAIKLTTGRKVTVVPVSEMNWGYWGNDVSISGTVTSNASQEIHLNDKQIVEEVYVKEGDTVEVGTPLLSFDLTMTSLNLESEKLNKEGLEIQKKGLENEINRLKNKSPISITPSAYETTADGGFLPLTASDTTQLPDTETTPDITPDTGNDTESDSESTPDPEPTPEPEPEPEPDPEPTPDPEPVPDPEPEPDPEPTPTPDSSSIPAYDCIDENSKYLGEGTKENPRCYLASYTEDYQARVSGKFLNIAKANGICFYIALRQENAASGELIASIFINGARLKDYDDAKTYLVTLYPMDEITEEPDKPETPEDAEDPDADLDDGMVLPDDSYEDGYADSEGYTQAELNQMLKEKQQELRTVNLNIRESELRIAEIEKSLEDQQITSTVTGIVKSVGDPEKGEVNGQAFLVVESTEGLYVQGYISELMLGQIQVGHLLNGTSYETGMTFEAEIREISPYPSDGDYYDGYGNTNASYYPFTAYIADGQGLSNNEYVGFTTTVCSDQTGSSIYLEKMFVREENGVSYVYIADEKNRLKKQEVTVKSLDGYTVQILSGLTNEDRITFPYGKNVKEGAPVKDGSLDDLYM